MATVYERAAAKVATMFAKYGVPGGITYERATAATVNGSAGTVTPGTPTTVTGVPAIILQASQGSIEAFDNRREDGSLKGLEIRYVKLAASDLAFAPKSDDKVTFAGKDWKVLGCTPVDITGADPLVYGIGVMAL